MKPNQNNRQFERRVSLQETMNQMARRMDGLLKDSALQTEKCAGDDETRLLIAVDPVLADLHKHLADAKANMRQLQKQCGDKDPMTEVARDATDSAHSAVETRLIELRQNTEKKAAIKAMIIREADEKEFAKREEIRLHNKAFWKEFSRSKAKKQDIETQAGDAFGMVLLSLMLLRHNLSRANSVLSIAATFSAVSANDRLNHATPIAGSV